MAVILVSQPNRTTNGLDTRAHAALSQLPFQFRREDFAVTSIIDNGSSQPRIRLDAALGNISALFVTGDQIYVDIAAYQGVHAIFAVGWSGSQTIMDISVPFTSGGTTFINLLTGTRADYKLVAYPVDSAGALRLGDNLYYQTSNNGNIFIDWTDIARGFLATLNVGSFQFRLRYFEYYNGANVGAAADSGTMQVLNARKQIKTLGGVAMWENLLRASDGALRSYAMSGTVVDDGGNAKVWFTAAAGNFSGVLRIGAVYKLNFLVNYKSGFYILLTTDFGNAVNLKLTFQLAYITTTGGAGTMINTDLPKLLTKFRNPVMWRGWDKQVSCLLDSQIQARTGLTNWRFYSLNTDINKTAIGGIANMGAGFFSFDPPQVIHRAVAIPVATAKFMRVYVRESTPSTIVSEALYYRVDEPCRNPVMIEWSNLFGALETWMFSIRQDVTNEAEEGVLFDRPIIVPYDQAEDVIGRQVAETKESILLTAEGLLIDQLRAIMEIKSSDYVYVWLDPTGGHKVRVRCTDLLQTGYSTNGKLFSIQIQLEMPPNFNLFEDAAYLNEAP